MKVKDEDLKREILIAISEGESDCKLCKKS